MSFRKVGGKWVSVMVIIYENLLLSNNEASKHKCKKNERKKEAKK